MTKNENLKISILSLISNVKIQYEKTYNNNSSFGIIVSYYYFPQVSGIKIEPVYRYYFKRHSPTGWYFEPKILIGYFNTTEAFYTEKYIYNSRDSLISHEIIDYLFYRKWRFIPIGVSLKLGNQSYFGKRQRFVFDYNFGFQYFPYIYPDEKEINYYFDHSGNRIKIVTTQGTLEDSFPYSFIWYLFGPGSVFQVNISLGYNF